MGLGLSGTNIGFALASELVTGKSRGPLLVLFELFFVAGSVFEAALWALGLHWRGAVLLTTAPLWVALLVSNCVPESPRHLVAIGESAATAASASPPHDHAQQENHKGASWTRMVGHISATFSRRTSAIGLCTSWFFLSFM